MGTSVRKSHLIYEARVHVWVSNQSAVQIPLRAVQQPDRIAQRVHAAVMAALERVVRVPRVHPEPQRRRG
eukprot:1042-Pelagococcus_subviridis.AAC.1